MWIMISQFPLKCNCKFFILKLCLWHRIIYIILSLVYYICNLYCSFTRSWRIPIESRILKIKYWRYSLLINICVFILIKSEIIVDGLIISLLNKGKICVLRNLSQYVWFFLHHLDSTSNLRFKKSTWFWTSILLTYY